MPTDPERQPLLGGSRGRTSNWWDFSDRLDDMTNEHSQFCKLTGCPPSNLPPGTDIPDVPTSSLYGRALEARKHQTVTYWMTAGLTNSLLLAQVILGAALTGLGASKADPILVTIFGAMNTIIAGVIAYLKSRGQPMRSRQYRDELERVVDEIENSEIMWRGKWCAVEPCSCLYH